MVLISVLAKLGLAPTIKDSQNGTVYFSVSACSVVNPSIACSCIVHTFMHCYLERCCVYDCQILPCICACWSPCCAIFMNHSQFSFHWQTSAFFVLHHQGDITTLTTDNQPADHTTSCALFLLLKFASACYVQSEIVACCMMCKNV